jgi:putative ABC transport system permease protein
MFHSVAQEIRYGFRRLRKQPGFTFFAALTLALGIGGAATIFSAIHHLLLDPFPYAKTGSILVLQVRDPASPRRGDRSFFQLPELLEYKTQVQAFGEVAAIDGGREIRLTTAQGTELIRGAGVSGNTFTFLGVKAIIGRVPTDSEMVTGAPPVFVMSHAIWVKRFGLDPTIIGRSFLLNGVPTILVGIMPPRFALLDADVWQPIALSASSELEGRFFHLYARLKPQATIEQAETQFGVVARRLATRYPRLYPQSFTVKAVTLVESIVGPIRTTLYMFAGAAGLLLLIACANVANMLLARSPARARELALQTSLGAGRGRIVRQQLVESLMLALPGAAIGILLAYVGLKALVALVPAGVIPAGTTIRMNLPVLAFGAGVTCLSVLLFGLLPALRSQTRELTPLLRGGMPLSQQARRRGFSGALVVSEVALSVVLLSGAGLLTRTFVNLQAIDLGLNPDNVLFARLRLPAGQYRDVESRHRLIGEVVDRLERLPGVVSVSAASAVPLGGGIRTGVNVPGTPSEATLTALLQLSTEGYFRTAQLRLSRGRVFTADDVRDARRVAVINEALARRYFGEENPIGHRIALTVLQRPPVGPIADPTFEIVGVVADSKNRGIKNPATPEAFIPSSVSWAYGRSIIIRTAVDPSSFAETVRREIWNINRDLVVENGTVDELLKTFSYAEPQFSLVVVSVFAGVALALVGLGVYGVLAYRVSQRTREIGIRMALGARGADVLLLVVGSGVRFVALGVLVGIPAALLGTRVLRNQLWGVTPNDPVTLVLVIVVVVAAAVSACYIPTRRATRIDPTVALRDE